MRVSRVISLAAAVVITATEVVWLSSNVLVSAPGQTVAASVASEQTDVPLTEVVVIGHRSRS